MPSAEVPPWRSVWGPSDSIAFGSYVVDARVVDFDPIAGRVPVQARGYVPVKRLLTQEYAPGRHLVARHQVQDPTRRLWIHRREFWKGNLRCKAMSENLIVEGRIQFSFRAGVHYGAGRVGVHFASVQY